ncbi:MAG: hypothetical protein HY390_00360 [Deltaproteobacteria bacterium]|nr:hypothetical protein [Deltaproteobacteria bacterium]
MRIFSYRTLSKEFQGVLYIWDVDKTYLNTNFESLKGLFKIMFEEAVDKVTIAGARELIIELRKGAETQIGIHPVYFISASPVQLRRVLEQKFLLDGIQHDGLILKDYRWFWKKYKHFPLKNNFVYKLICLLSHRLTMPPTSQEILFGDDFEQDDKVYVLYANILNGTTTEKALKSILKQEEAKPREISDILQWVKVLQEKKSAQPVVQKIFIHLIGKKKKADLLNHGQIIATRNYLQTAAILYELKKISKLGFRKVANAFDIKYAPSEWSFRKSLEDLKERKLITEVTYDELSNWK